MTIEREPTKRQSEENKIDMEILRNITMTEYNMTEDQFTKLVDALKPLSCSNLPDWSYEHATSFTVQLLTTIGYGNITPRTAAGQIVTIVYALFGIPWLTLLTLKSIGGGCNKLVKCIITMIENCFRGKQPEIKNIELKALIANVFLLVALILTSAIMSSYENPWSIREGIYVWFITLTTVGFGDFVPKIMMRGGQPNALILPGLCFMSGVVDALVEYVNKADVRILRCRGAACLCRNNSTHSSPGDNVIETADTQDPSCNNSGSEAATTQQDALVEYPNKADVRVSRCRGEACLCCNKTNPSSDGDNMVETDDTQDRSCINLNPGIEAATTQQDALNSYDTTL
ncbi:two pore potassium channel protein sup-9-like [Oculina patagonica]